MDNKRRSNRAVTASDVARQAGVSQATVSRVFNKDCKVQIHPQSRQRVLRAAEALGYIPNAIAQIMSSGRSGIIGIVVSNYYNLFYYNILRMLTNELQKQGFRTMVFTTDPQEDLDALMEGLYQYQVDGVIVTSSAMSYQLNNKWNRKGMPVVMLNGYRAGREISAVTSDQFGSGQMMADYLARTGHHRIAYLTSENSPHKNMIPRQEGFLKGLERNGIRDCHILPGGYSYESGLSVGRSVLAQSDRPDAIFCSGDLNAMGIMDAVRERNDLVLGRDISVTGYDAPILTDLLAYPLTVLTQQSQRLCRDCVNLLLATIENPDTPIQVITRPMILTLRASSRPDVSE